MDVQARLQEAIDLHRNGDLDAAYPIYKEILDEEPNQADALHFAGLLAHQKGDDAQGIDLIQRSLKIFPGNAGAHNNLGNIYKRAGKSDEAIESYSAALGISPNHADTWNNFGVLLRTSQRFEEAEKALKNATTIDKKHAEAWHNLGLLYLLTSHLEAAGDAFEACLDLGTKRWGDPVWHARVLCAIGRRDRALEQMELHLQRHPDDPVAKHQIAALRGEVVDRASDGYVKKHFDSFAESFDEVLARLDYRAPEIVAEVVDRLMEGREPIGDVLDLGCGTGLCGPLIRQHCKVLTGMDLSEGMLRKAAELKNADGGRIYDHLVEAELVTFLREAPRDCFGMATCVDTLCYFGPLEDMMEALTPALRPGGIMVATVEKCEDLDGPGYLIDQSGRYSHTEPYLRQAAAGAGLDFVSSEPQILRKELGSDVHGYVFVVQRPTG
ncbi:MAG: tetratricopeptide repeat protein [Pseudomonadota bacterium]